MTLQELLERVEELTSGNKTPGVMVSYALTEEAEILAKLVKEYEAALKLVSSVHIQKHDSEDSWIEVGLAQCASVLATDTKIAREALAKGEEIMKEIK